MEGHTALKHYSPNPAQAIIGDHLYVFMPKANISMAWVQDEDVDRVLSIKKVCCGGSKKPKFRRANEDDIRRWTNGGGR